MIHILKPWHIIYYLSEIENALNNPTLWNGLMHNWTYMYKVQGEGRLRVGGKWNLPEIPETYAKKLCEKEKILRLLDWEKNNGPKDWRS